MSPRPESASSPRRGSSAVAGGPLRILDLFSGIERLARWNRAALKALGNSVVPQVVAVIGQAIAEAERLTRRIAALALLALLLPGCSARYSIPIAAGADIATTEVALNRYELQEANPLLQTTSARVGWKVGLTVALVWLAEELDDQGRHGTARAVQWLATGLWAGAAVWNVHQIHLAKEAKP